MFLTEKKKGFRLHFFFPRHIYYLQIMYTLHVGGVGAPAVGVSLAEVRVEVAGVREGDGGAFGGVFGGHSHDGVLSVGDVVEECLALGSFRHRLRARHLRLEPRLLLGVGKVCGLSGGGVDLGGGGGDGGGDGGSHDAVLQEERLERGDLRGGEVLDGGGGLGD